MPVERQIAEEVEPVDLISIMDQGEQLFSVPERPAKRRTTTRVQYDAEKEYLDGIRKHLRRSRLSATKIALHTFNYFLDQEGLR